MHRLLPLFLVLSGLVLGYFSIGSIGNFAHFHFANVCIEGERLSNELTPELSVKRFRDYCSHMHSIFSKDYRQIFYGSLIGGMASLVLILLGINFRVVSKWYAKFI